jgi:polyhydroxyalkanoate synthesis regulator protein
MKISVIQLGVMMLHVGILFPMPGLSYSQNRTEINKQPPSILLTQVASYRPLVDAVNREEQLAIQASSNFFTAWGQLGNANNANTMRLTNVLIETSAQAAAHNQRSSEFGLKSLPYYAGDPLAQTALDSFYRLNLEMAQIFRGYNQLSQQTRSAFRSNDVSKLNVLNTKFQMLGEQRNQNVQMQQQITQAYQNRSNAANAQLINNFSRQMGNGIIQRGQATKCMVSNLPYGSRSQIANNPTAYCNSR